MHATSLLRRAGLLLLALAVLAAIIPPGTVRAAVATVLVDDVEPRFTRGTTLDGWHTTHYGYGDHLFWVWNDTSEARYWGRWTPALPGAGNYEVQAYIPRYCFGTTAARYRICHNGRWDDRVISQAIYYDEWVSLGTYDFHGQGGEYALLASNTGEPAGAHAVGYDVMRFVPLGAAVPPGSVAPASQPAKRIMIDVSEQRMRVYENDTLQWDWLCSTGVATMPTRYGTFEILDKIPTAWSAPWSLSMPYWMGIYWAGASENGIHALPILQNGQTLWSGYLGGPVSFGCIVLDTPDAAQLYEWADIGTPVIITP